MPKDFEKLKDQRRVFYIETHDPEDEQFDIKSFVLFIALMISGISFFIFLAVNFSKNLFNHPAYIIGSIVFFGGFLVAIIRIFGKNNFRKYKLNIKKNIEISNGTVVWPSCLVLKNYSDEVDKNQNYSIRIDNIEDFVSLPAGKNTKARFEIKMKNRINDDGRLVVLNTLSKKNEDLLFSALNSQWSSSKENSPFSQERRNLRQLKTRVGGAFYILGTFAVVVEIFLITFNYPIFFYSTLILFLIYSLLPSNLLTLFLYNLLKAREGSKALTFKHFIFTVFLSSLPIFHAAFFTVESYWPVQNTTIDVEIIDKEAIRHKSSYSYFLYLAPKADDLSVTNILEETMSARVSKIDFKTIEVGSSATLKVKIGIFGIPLQEKIYPIRNTQGLRKTIPINEQLLQWEATYPDFPGNPDYKIEKWPNGSVKSKEPLLNGEAHGLATYWHPNGVIYSKIYWVEGEKHGRYETHREDGSLEGSFSMKRGQKHGEARWYDKQGQLKTKAIYENDKLVH